MTLATHIPVPRKFLEEVSSLRLSPPIDAILQSLMDRNNNSQLPPRDHEHLKALVEWSESLSLLRAQALLALGRKPE